MALITFRVRERLGGQIENGLGRFLSRRLLTFVGLGIAALIALRYFMEYQESFWQMLHSMKDTWASFGILGHIALASMVFVSCFPLMPGFSSLMTLGGIFYGFPYGFVPVLVGAVAGTVASFQFGRYCARSGWIDMRATLRKMVELSGLGAKEEARLTQLGLDRSMISADAIATRAIHRLELALRNRGYTLLILLRLCPYPWSLSSLLLSQIETLSFTDYAVTSTIALLRCLLYVWIGSELGRGSEGQGLFSIVLGEGVGVLATIYVYWVVRKELDAQDVPLDMEALVPPRRGAEGNTDEQERLDASDDSSTEDSIAEDTFADDTRRRRDFLPPGRMETFESVVSIQMSRSMPATPKRMDSMDVDPTKLQRTQDIASTAKAPDIAAWQQRPASLCA